MYINSLVKFSLRIHKPNRCIPKIIMFKKLLKPFEIEKYCNVYYKNENDSVRYELFLTLSQTANKNRHHSTKIHEFQTPFASKWMYYDDDSQNAIIITILKFHVFNTLKIDTHTDTQTKRFRSPSLGDGSILFIENTKRKIK